MGDVAGMVALYAALRERRYPTMLVVHESVSALAPDLLQHAANETGASYVDFIHEATAGETQVVAGAFMRHHFLKWLKEQARAKGGLWVENADAVIATWPEREQREFFMEFLKTESRSADGVAAPIVVASALAGRFTLPEEPRGWGVVVRV